MNLFIKYLKGLIIPLGVIFLFPLILAILNLLSLKTNNIFILIIMAITLFISGYFIGRTASKRGYINGLGFGLIISLIMFLFSLLFKNHYSFNTLIYYTIIILASTFGSMIGIQKKAN